MPAETIYKINSMPVCVCDRCANVITIQNVGMLVSRHSIDPPKKKTNNDTNPIRKISTKTTTKLRTTTKPIQKPKERFICDICQRNKQVNTLNEPVCAKGIKLDIIKKTNNCNLFLWNEESKV